LLGRSPDRLGARTGGPDPATHPLQDRFRPGQSGHHTSGGGPAAGGLYTPARGPTPPAGSPARRPDHVTGGPPPRVAVGAAAKGSVDLGVAPLGQRQRVRPGGDAKRSRRGGRAVLRPPLPARSPSAAPVRPPARDDPSGRGEDGAGLGAVHGPTGRRRPPPGLTDVIRPGGHLP